MNDFSKPQTGDDFIPSAAKESAMLDMLADFLARTKDKAIVAAQKPDVLVRNMRGSGLLPFSVVRIGDFAIDPAVNLASFKNDRVFDTDFPVKGAPFGITQEPIADGGIGEVRVAGATICKVDFSDESHKFADVDSANYDNLVSRETSGSVRILKKQDGDGIIWALVVFHFATEGFDGFTGCEARENPCTGETDYEWWANGQRLNKNDPCPACEDPPVEVAQCGPCIEGPETFCFSITGLTNSICDDCEDLAAHVFTLTKNRPDPDVNCLYGFSGAVTGLDCSGPFSITFSYSAVDDKWSLWIHLAAASTSAFYTATGGSWNCNTPLVLFKQTAASVCASWPATITIESCDCVSYPTVTLDTSDLIGSSASITIAGTGFSTTPAENTVIFDNGAAGIVTAATTTSLTVDFTTQPVALGDLKATVIVNGCSSGALVQVATIINPLVIDCSDASLWCDSLTDTDGVHLDAHTPEVGGTYTVTDGTPGIYGNRLVDLAGGTGVAFNFDTTATAYRWRFKYLAPPTSQDSGYRTLQACFRWTNSSNNFLLLLQFAPGTDTATSFFVYKTVSGVLTSVGTGSVTLYADTSHLIEVEVIPARVSVTIHGVKVTAADTDLNTATELAVSVASGNSTVLAPWIDDNKVNAIGLKTHTIDALLKTAGILKTHTINALLKKTDNLLTHTIDAYLAAGAPSYYWQDTFTDTNNTDITSHTGETTPGGYSNFDSSRYEILSNRLYVKTLSGGNAYTVFSNGHAEFTLNADILIAPTATDNSDRQMTIFFRFVDGNNYHYLNLTMATGNNSTIGWFLVKNVSGTPTTINSGSWSLNSNTVHAVVMTVTSTGISGTVGGNSFSGSSSSANTEDTIILGTTSSQTGTNGHYWDNLTLVP